MSYQKKTWSNGDDVTPEDFNRIENGIEDNANKINNLNEVEVIDLSEQLLNGVTVLYGSNSYGVINNKIGELSLILDLHGYDFFGDYNNTIMYLPEKLRPVVTLADMYCSTSLGAATVTITTDGCIHKGNIAPSGIPSWVIITIPAYICVGGE